MAQRARLGEMPALYLSVCGKLKDYSVVWRCALGRLKLAYPFLYYLDSWNSCISQLDMDYGSEAVCIR